VPKLVVALRPLGRPLGAAMGRRVLLIGSPHYPFAGLLFIVVTTCMLVAVAAARRICRGVRVLVPLTIADNPRADPAAFNLAQGSGPRNWNRIFR